MPVSQVATLLVNWDLKWGVETKCLIMRSPFFFWRGGSLSVLYGHEYRPHRRPRCLLTEILNEMGSKRNVKTEVPFFCGGSLALSVCLFWAAKECRLHKRPTLLVNWDPKWDAKTKCLKWGPFFGGGSLSVCSGRPKNAGFTGVHVAY
jgi:hypothetical protein